jgi:hypothetical protein
MALRHSDIRVTSQVYVDARSRATVALGYLLAPDKVVEFKKSEVA